MQYPATAATPHALHHTPSAWHAWLLMAAACLLCCVNPAWAQNNAAAKVIAVAGQAKAIDAQGRERTLDKGAELFAGDKVVTADASLVQVRLNDGGYMSIRAHTEMVIDQFVYDEKEPSKSNFLVSLLRGGFRSITGQIGRSNPRGYQIRAATATIGIRGTDHEPVLVLDTPEAQLQTQGAPGLYDKVNDGETFITSKAGVLSLKRGDIGFLPLGSNLPPQVLLKIPEFYKANIRTETPEPKDGSGDGNKGAAGGDTGMRPSLLGRRDAAPPGGTAPIGADTTTPPGPTPTTPTRPMLISPAPQPSPQPQR